MASETVSRICTECKEEFPCDTAHFYWRMRPNGTDEWSSRCRPCTRRQKKEWVLKQRNGKTCEWCSTDLLYQKRFCSQQCHVLSNIGGLGAQYNQLTALEYLCREDGKSVILWRCVCGNERWVRPSYVTNGTIRCCGKRGCKRPWNRGPYRMMRNGYAYVYEPNHPNAKPSTGRVAEHTFVMAQHLGRPLQPYETVHHKNGQRSQNDLSNLELWCVGKSHRPGQRVEDLVAWAKELIALYEPDLPKLAALHDADSTGGRADATV
jgi:hypothetical protein